MFANRPVFVPVGAALVAAVAVTTVIADGPDVAPVNDLLNPYRTIDHWGQLPTGREWGSTSAVEIDKDGRSVWVAERCGANSCLDRPQVDPILKFDASGTLVKSFGAGLLIFPHGIFVDHKGNVWVTDGQDNAPRPSANASAPNSGGPGSQTARQPIGPVGPPPGATQGHLVYEFSPAGAVIRTLGQPGGEAEPGYFYQPNDVLVAPDGAIFVSEGHGSGNNRILKFSKEGRLVKTWGNTGTGPGEFDQPHALAMDSRGRLFVGDRNNNRLQIFDQQGTFLAQWRQFSRPSGLYIDRHDVLYVADSESGSVSRNHPGWKRGIRIGSAADGTVKAFIPDPVEHATGTSAAEGVAADSQGNIYGAEVGPKDVKKYVRK